ncbi:TraG P-loop domain-containing protein [Deinococcus saxicola]
MPYSDVFRARKVAQSMGNLTPNLTYQGLDDGVVFTLDNKMTFGVRLELVSAARATDDVRLIIRDRLIQTVKGSLPVGACVRFYFETHPATRTSLARHAPDNHGPSPLQQMLEANYAVLERMRRTNWVSESGAYLTVTLGIRGRLKKRAYTADELAPLLEKARALRARFVRQLTLAGMRAAPMQSSDAWGRIMNYFNPSAASAEPPAYLPALDEADLAAVRVNRKFKNNPRVPAMQIPTMRAQIACSDIDLDYDGCFMLGHSRVGVVSFLKPSGTTATDATEGVIEALGGTHSLLMVEYLVVDAPKSRAEINASLDRQETAASETSLKAGREVLGRIESGTDLLHAIEAGNVLTEMSMHAIIFARDQEELDDRRERTLAAFSSVGGAMPRAAASGPAIQLFLENAPFGGARSSYRVAAYYHNAVDCMPKTGPWMGTPGGVLPLRGRKGNVFSVSPIGPRNAGVVVCGSSGGGKSVLINMLSSGLVHKYGASLTVVDPKRDYLALFMALGALDAVVNVAPGARLPSGQRVIINPFDLPEGVPTLTAEKSAYLLEIMRALRVNDLSGRRVSILQQAITNFYLRFSRPQEIEGRVVNVYTRDGELSDFQAIVSRLNTVGEQSIQNNPDLREEVSNIANELRAYCGDTPLGSLLDGQTTVNLDSRYLYLDISGMLAHSQLAQIGSLLTNELVWNRASRLEGKGVVVIEEAGVARELSGVVELVARLFKTGRSLDIIPILSMQEIEDALAYRGVINNASTRILLASAPSERAQIAGLFGLNPAMAGLHASLGGESGRFKEALVLQDGDNNELDGDVGQLWLSAEAYWMSTSQAEEALLRRQVAADLFGGDESRAAIYIAREAQNAA